MSSELPTMATGLPRAATRSSTPLLSPPISASTSSSSFVTRRVPAALSLDAFEREIHQKQQQARSQARRLTATPQVATEPRRGWLPESKTVRERSEEDAPPSPAPRSPAPPSPAPPSLAPPRIPQTAGDEEGPRAPMAIRGADVHVHTVRGKGIVLHDHHHDEDSSDEESG